MPSAIQGPKYAAASVPARTLELPLEEGWRCSIILLEVSELAWYSACAAAIRAIHCAMYSYSTDRHITIQSMGTADSTVRLNSGRYQCHTTFHIACSSDHSIACTVCTNNSRPEQRFMLCSIFVTEMTCMANISDAQHSRSQYGHIRSQHMPER